MTDPRAGRAALTVAALGVVFGDIGTSPLYALHAVFTTGRGVAPSEPAVYGVISLVFWAITLVVSVKYVTFIMRADNDGEGGIMALIALLSRVRPERAVARAALVVLGIFGAALFYGDGMITPAISVLSAVEGLKVAAPSLGDLVVPITLAVLAVLFAIQRFGTGAVGRLFGPIMAVWFGALAIAGIHQVAKDPAILKALSPSYGIEFFADHFAIAFGALASVVLVVTGAEALYADMGHFGRGPIRRAWFFIVFPALVLNYLGQGSLILETPRAVASPFFLLMPHWARIPTVLLATAATVIASQAVISGAFSMTRQAVQLGFLPRVTIRHTSAREIGQVYAPAINWGLFLAVAGLVLGFGSSAHLASAYGIAVTGTMTITTVLFFVMVRELWRRPLWIALAGAAAFLTVELAFLAANVHKVVHGGWFPLAVALALYAVMTTWKRGREIVTRNRTEEEGPLRDFVDQIHAMDPPVYRPPRTAVFLNRRLDTTPLALRANVTFDNVLHENVVILSIEVLRVPHADVSEQLTMDDLGYRDDGITHVTACFGYLDKPNVPRVLRAAADRLEREVDLDTVVYFLSRITIIPTRAPGMARWRKRLFVAMARNAADPVEYFELPSERSVVMGAHIEM